MLKSGLLYFGTNVVQFCSRANFLPWSKRYESWWWHQFPPQHQKLSIKLLGFRALMTVVYTLSISQFNGSLNEQKKWKEEDQKTKRPKLKSLIQKSNLTYMVKAENLKSLCAHFMSCDYEKITKKAYKVNSWQNTTNPPYWWVFASWFYLQNCCGNPLASWWRSLHSLIQGPAGIFMQINIKEGFLYIAYH